MKLARPTAALFVTLLIAPLLVVAGPSTTAGAVEAPPAPDLSTVEDLLAQPPLSNGEQVTGLATSETGTTGGTTLPSGVQGILVGERTFEGGEFAWATGIEPNWLFEVPAEGTKVDLSVGGAFHDDISGYFGAELLEFYSFADAAFWNRDDIHSECHPDWDQRDCFTVRITAEPGVETLPNPAEWKLGGDCDLRVSIYGPGIDCGVGYTINGGDTLTTAGATDIVFSNEGRAGYDHSMDDPDGIAEGRALCAKVERKYGVTCWPLFTPTPRELVTEGICLSPAGVTSKVIARSASYTLNDPTPQIPSLSCPAGSRLVSVRVYRRSTTQGLLPTLDLIAWSEDDDPTGGRTAIGTTAVTLGADQVEGGGYPAGTVADPVNTATGALVESAVDLGVSSYGVAPTLDRFYDSDRTDAGILGTGWRTSYEQHLSGDLGTTTGAQVTYRAPAGYSEVHTRLADGSYASPPGSGFVLADVAGGFELRDTHPDSPTVAFDSAGRLTGFVDRHGNTTTVSLDANGHPDLVTAANGRWLDLDVVGGLLELATTNDGRTIDYGYTSGRLTSVTDATSHTLGYRYDANGRLDQATDPTGHPLHTTTYNTNGDVVTQVDAAGETWGFAHALDAAGTGIVRTTDPNGAVWADVYRGRVLIGRVDPYGNHTRFHYNDQLQLQWMSGPAGNTMFGYDDQRRLTTTITPQGTATTTYDAAGRTTSTTSIEGLATSYTYDAAGNVATITAPGERTTTFDHNSRGLLQSTTTPGGRTTTFDYDAQTGDLLSTTRPSAAPSGEITTWTYDAAGRPVSMVDPRGNATAWTQTVWTEVISEPPADLPVHNGELVVSTTGQVVENLRITGHVTIDAPGVVLRNVVIETNSRDYAITTTSNTDVTVQDSLITLTSNAKGAVHSRKGSTTLDRVVIDDTTGSRSLFVGDVSVTDTSDPVWQVIPHTIDHPAGDPADYTTTFGYDAAGRPTTVTDQIGRTITTGYDAGGRPATITDSTGRTVTTGYDGAGRVVSLQGPDASIPAITTTYDALGNVASRTDADGITATFEYDAMSRLVRVPIPGTTSQTTFTYDAAGRIAAASRAPSTYEATYDADGRLERVFQHGENSFYLDYTYDTNGRVAQVLFTPAGGQKDPPRSTDYSYDPATGALASATVDGSITTQYTYDQATGELVSRTSPGSGGTRTETFAYDPAGRITTAAVDGQRVASYAYDPTGQLLHADLANGLIHQRSYDRSGRIVSLSDASDTGTLFGRAYTWDDRDLPTLISETLAGTTTDTAYRYDVSGRLVAQCEAATACPDGTTGAGVTEWTYTATGHPLTRTTPVGTDTWAYDAATARPSSYTPAGGATRQLQTDWFGHITDDGVRALDWQISLGVLYDASYLDGSGTSDYRYDEKLQLTEVTESGPGLSRTTTSNLDPLSGNTMRHERSGSSPSSDWDYLPGGVGADVDGNRTFFHRDELGSVRATSDAAGAADWMMDYAPYGTATATQLDTSADRPLVGFTGQVEDRTTDLVHLGARWYDPELQLFLSPDPAGHGYAYAHGNPIVFIDPYGLFGWATVRGPTRFINTVAGWTALAAGAAAAGSAATGIGLPVAGVLSGVAAYAGAVDAATGVIIAVDNCVNNKGSCVGGAGLAALGALPGPNISRALPGAGVADDVARVADDVPAGQAQVRTNQQIGDSASDSIAATIPNAQREVTLQAASGSRRVDVLTPQGLAIESKVGRTSLTRDTRRQIARDIELLTEPMSDVNGLRWEFFVSPITGQGGPTRPLARALEEAGIPYVVHPYGPGL